VLVWRWSKLSRRRRLNHGETERYWEAIIQAGGKPSAWQAEQLTRAGPCEGPSAFDWRVEIIQRHPDRLSLHLE